jgi:soluble lytic murein transglycosylase-like protein
MGAAQPNTSGLTTQQVQQMITNAANSAGIPPSVALAVAQHESGFNPSANAATSGVCPAGQVCTAAGVFQLTQGTQQTLGVTNPFDPTQNINAGVNLLAQYYNTYGNWNDALQAFSQGPGTVQQGQPPSAQTIGLINYVSAQSGGAIPTAPTTAANGTTISPGTPTLDQSAPTDNTGLDLSSLNDQTTQAGTIDWSSWLIWGGIGFAAVVGFYYMSGD